MVNITDLRKKELRAELQARALTQTGSKCELFVRLKNELKKGNEDCSDFVPKGDYTNLYPSSTCIRIEFLPPLAPFDVHADSNVAPRWLKWKRAFQIYVKALGKVNSTQKKNLLLYVAGYDVQEIHSTFSASQVATFDSLMASLDSYFDPKKNKRFERFKFRHAEQTLSESMDSYIIRLRKLGETCEFQDLDDHILDQIIEKGRNSVVRRKLLELGNDMSLTKAADVARAVEESGHQLRDMKGRESFGHVDHVRESRPTSRRFSPRARAHSRHSRAHFSTIRGGSRSRDIRARSESRSHFRTCYRCGDHSHLANDPNCSARSATCRNCSKVGHLSILCNSGTSGNATRNIRPNNFVNRVDAQPELGADVVTHGLDEPVTARVTITE